MLNPCEDVDVLTEFDKDKFEKTYHTSQVAFETVKAIKLDNDLWIPKSQCRVDFDENIWVSHWWLDNH